MDLESDKPQLLAENKDKNADRLQGWPLRGTTIACLLCVFLANLEIAIVSTSLVAITDDLNSFEKSSWIITSYLLTYTGFLIFWAKLSDSLGRRQCLCAALLIFVAASGACGGAQTTEQLIVFRAFQGIGGSGLLSLTFVIMPEMVEPKKFALYASFTSGTLILGFLFGPLLGGAIVNNTTWRWVFLINLPMGIVTFILICVFIPVGFPNIHAPRGILRLRKLREIDYIGAALVLGTSGFVVSALEEAGTAYAWSSPVIVVLLILTALCMVGFVTWQYWIEKHTAEWQAVFTWRLMTHRVFMGSLLVTFLAGVSFTVSVIQIPQEFQTVFGTDALTAGVRLLPFTLCYSVGTVISMVMSSKLQVPPVFVILMGGSLQVLGAALMSLVPLRSGAGKYIAEILLAIGVGENIGVTVQLTPQLITGKDIASAMGAMTQFRALGGVIGFAITTNVFNGYISSALAQQLTPQQLTSLLESVTTAIASLPPGVQDAVRATFADAYDLEIKILIGVAVGQMLAVALMWERQFRRLL